jgi:hypothetical protein
MWRVCRGLILALALPHAPAPAQTDIPALRPGELPGLEIRRTEGFAGDALYGYINGGADLYHEYGFEQLSVQDVRVDSDAHFIEVYLMADPGGAFGIFSISHGECTPADSLPESSCASPRVVQWAQSRYFVRIAGESWSPEAQAARLRLARTLSVKIPGDAWIIPAVPAAAGGTERTLLLVRGALGMQNGFDRWSSLVEGLENFEAAIASREDSTGYTAIGEFRFAADTDLDRFSRAFSGRGKVVRSVQKSGRRLLVLEADSNSDSLWSELVGMP